MSNENKTGLDASLPPNDAQARSAQQEDGELSDGDLDNVSGGILRVGVPLNPKTGLPILPGKNQKPKFF